MERSREARRMSMAAANGLARRRQRSSSLRDSPEDDGVLELQETVRLRDRGSVKKDRDRDRDRDHRERDRDRDRSSRSKRRRSDGRLMHGSHREDGGDETTDESVNEDEDEDDDDGGGGAAAAASLRMLPPNPSSLSNNHHLHRKSFPPAKGYRAAAPPSWKAADEMIGVSVPRKARSASTKRTHEWMLGNNGGAGGVTGEQVLRQASTSPVRTSLVAAASSPAPISPPSSTNASARKKLKPNVPKQRVPKTSSKSSSSNQDEIEFEIAEVLYEMRQNQGPSKQEGNDSVKFETRDTIKASVDAKSGVSSPISNSSQPQASSILQQNSSSSAAPLTAIAPKRKKPRPMREEENLGFFGSRSSPISASATKAETEQLPKTEICSTNLESKSGSAVENGVVAFGSVMPDTAQFNESRPQIDLMVKTVSIGLCEMRIVDHLDSEKHDRNDSVKFETRDTIKATVDAKSGVSSPISTSSQPQASSPISILMQNSGSASLTAIAQPCTSLPTLPRFPKMPLPPLSDLRAIKLVFINGFRSVSYNVEGGHISENFRDGYNLHAYWPLRKLHDAGAGPASPAVKQRLGQRARVRYPILDFPNKLEKEYIEFCRKYWMNLTGEPTDNPAPFIMAKHKDHGKELGRISAAKYIRQIKPLAEKLILKMEMVMKEFNFDEPLTAKSMIPKIVHSLNVCPKISLIKLKDGNLVLGGVTFLADKNFHLLSYPNFNPEAVENNSIFTMESKTGRRNNDAAI